MTDPAVELAAWAPPTIPPNNRTNATPRDNNHPTDHNQIADALTALVAAVTPWANAYSPRYGSVASPWGIGGSLIFPGSTGLTWLVYARIANIVHVSAGLFLQAQYSLPGATNGLVTLKLPWIPDPNIYKVTGDAQNVAGRVGGFQVAGIPSLQGTGVVNLNQATPTSQAGLFTSYWNGTQIAWSALLRQHIDNVGSVVSGSFHYVTADQGNPAS
jgi:hypothetical protein